MKLPKPRKRGDSYRIEIMIKGKRYSATRDTAKECTQWAIAKITESKITQENKSSPTLDEILSLYQENIAKNKRSKTAINDFIARFRRDYPNLCIMQIHEITPQDLTIWRNHRLCLVSEPTVLRDFSFLSPVFTYAVKELFVIEKNPFSQVVKPRASIARNRRITDDEIKKVLDTAGYKMGDTPTNSRQYIAWIFMFAINTTMRWGEIVNIKKSDIKGNHVHLPITKNGDSRDVPLNTTARQMLTWIEHDGEMLIPINRGAISMMWATMKKEMSLPDLHLHDTRHEAISRFVKEYKMPVETLAKITGHRDLRVLLNTYYNPTIDELAEFFK